MTGQRPSVGVGELIARIALGAAQVLAALAFMPNGARLATACPFCSTLEPTLAQRREAAAAVVLAEVDRIADDGQAVLVVRQWLKKPQAPNVDQHPAIQVDDRRSVSAKDAESIHVRLASSPGTLVIAFGDQATAADETLAWVVVPMQERALGYFVHSPDLRKPAAERLSYFSRFLQNPDALIAADAYAEFGYAGFGDVETVAQSFDSSRLREWVASASVPPVRTGLYALMLGLAVKAEDRERNRMLLEKVVRENRDDFRAGFDGIVAGYLLLAGEQGLELVDRLYLGEPRAASGHVRQVQRALRFYLEYGRDIPTSRLARSARLALGRPEVAADTIKDLSRWRDWSAAREIGELWDKPDYSDREIRLAIVGYLLAAPDGDAAATLAALRQRDPTGVAEAERNLAASQSIGR